MSNRILVTGSQGFIGRYLVQNWLEHDPESRIFGIGRSERLDRSFTHRVHWGSELLRAPLPTSLQPDTNGHTSYEYRQLDLTDRPTLIRYLQEIEPDYVFHMAASLRDEDPEVLIRNNVSALNHLLEAIVGAGVTPKRIVLGSSGSVYGTSSATPPFAEGHECVPVDPYSVSKRAAEDLSRILAKRNDLPIIWARIFNPVGPGQDERHLCGWITQQVAAIQKGIREPIIEIGPLDTTRDFIDIRDVAEALRLLATRGESGEIYNVGSGIECVCQTILDESLRISGLADRISLKKRPARPADVPRLFADISRIEAIGYRAGYSIENSLTDLLGYYLETVSSAALAESNRLAEESRQDEHASLEVRIKQEHSYDVQVECGLLRSVPAIIKRRYRNRRVVVLTDERVRELYGEELLQGLRNADIPSDMVSIPEGEGSKAFDPFRTIIEQLHDARFDRRAILLNLGGGLITDVGGYVASSYMRGVSYLNVPTTLLAQHDSSIGGKVAINTRWAKNFVGAFHHPSGVYCDPLVLRTLSSRDFASGVAEAIKVAMCGEVTLFELLEKNGREIFEERDEELMEAVVRRCAARKIALLDPDPYEVDLRRVLNLGHTFGHPLETELEYEGLLHGEAVGFGIAVSTAIAYRQGVCNRETLDRIFALLDAYNLPPSVDRTRLRKSCDRLDDIRLVRGNRLNFVMPISVGRVKIVPEIERSEFEEAIDFIADHPVLGGSVQA